MSSIEQLHAELRARADLASERAALEAAYRLHCLHTGQNPDQPTAPAARGLNGCTMPDCTESDPCGYCERDHGDGFMTEDQPAAVILNEDGTVQTAVSGGCMYCDGQDDGCPECNAIRDQYAAHGQDGLF